MVPPPSLFLMPNPSSLKDWILVVDSDRISQKQVRVCQRLQPGLKGVEDCSAEHHNESLCNECPYFPSFCRENAEGDLRCVSGLRSTRDALEELGELNFDS